MLFLLSQLLFMLPVAFAHPLSGDTPEYQDPKYYNRAQAFVGEQSVVSVSPMAKDRNGNFVLVNQCNYDIYIWEAWVAHQSDPIKVPARSPFRKEIISSYDLPKGEKCVDNCGVTYKVSKTKQLTGGRGGNQLQFEFTTRMGLMYFDMSFVDCAKNLKYRTGDASNCPSWAEGIRIEGQKSPQHDYGCDFLECMPGEMCIHDGYGAYYVDEPKLKWGFDDPVKTCPTYKSGMELYFRTCYQNPDLDH